MSFPASGSVLSRFARRGVPVLDKTSAWLIAGCIAAAAGVFVVGPVAIILAVVAVALAAVFLPRPDWTLGGLALAGLLAVAKTPLIGGFALSRAATPGRTLFLALLALQTIRLLVGTRVPIGRMLSPILPLLAVIALSLLAAPARPTDELNALPFAVLIASASVIAWPLTASDEWARRTIMAIAFAYGLVTVLNVLLIPISTHPAFVNTSDYSQTVPVFASRFAGILENPNSNGYMGYVGIPALIAAARLSRQTWGRPLCLGVASLLALEVGLSVSRTGMASMAAAALVMWAGLTNRRISARSIAIAAGVALVLIISLSGLADQVLSALRLPSLAEGSGRIEVWPQMIDKIGERPFLGFGYSSTPDVISAIHFAGPFVGRYSGNALIDLGVELGVLGLIAFSVALTVGLWRGLTARPQSEIPRVARLTYLAIAVGALMEAQGESGLTAPGGPSVATFWFSLAALGAVASAGATRKSPSYGPATPVDRGLLL